jgi:hypothetical protein
MVGEMDDQIVVRGPERGEELALGRPLRAEAGGFPPAVDRVDARDRGMVLEHRRRLDIDERIDLGRRRRALERGEHRRGKQHVAVVAQLGDQHAPQSIELDGVRRVVAETRHDGER